MTLRYEVRIAGEITQLDGDKDVAAAAQTAQDILTAITELTPGGRVSPIGEAQFNFFMIVEDAASPLDAVLSGATILRAAAHAAHVYTNSWPGADEWHGMLKELAVEAEVLPEGHVLAAT